MPAGQSAAERVRQRVGEDVVRLLEEELSPSELTTLLLSVAASRAARVDVARLRSTTQEDRFTRPATTDPRALARLDHECWQLLPQHFEAIDLSPLAPLGICSALAGVHQNRVVTTMRGHEVVSDATNVLALEAARRRQQASTVHLAASHRMLRAQHFEAGRGFSAHFRLFNLVSSARDRGSGGTEVELLLAHLRAWAGILGRLLPSSAHWYVDYTCFREGPASERLLDAVIPALTAEGLSFRELTARTGADYYTELAFKIHVEVGDEKLEIGDGGLTDWTARLMNDAKERCLISCIATERLATLLRS